MLLYILEVQKSSIGVQRSSPGDIGCKKSWHLSSSSNDILHIMYTLKSSLFRLPVFRENHSMSQRPTLKLKLSALGSPSSIPVNSSGAASPSGTTATTPRIKLKLTATPKALEAPQLPDNGFVVASKPKKVKKERPTQLSTGKKRKRDNALGDNGADNISKSSPALPTASLKLKLNPRRTPTTPFIKMKAKGKPPNRPLGVGYDSEASDREIDPAIEEEFILRMQPGDDCEYLRKAIEENRWGPRMQGGADIRLKFLQSQGRRAVLIIRGHLYAATLVDLPCVVEAMKSWDRRGWWKTADICQMLLVLGTVKTEAEALEYPLPGKELDKSTFQYAHGLTPPMRWVRKRRFRKRVSNKTIEAVEQEVERLLAMDEESHGRSKYEMLDLDRLSKGQSVRESEDEAAYGLHGEEQYGEQDAEGEEDVGEYAGGFEMDDDELAADLEKAMMESDAGDALAGAIPTTTVAIPAEIPTNSDSEAATPSAMTPGKDDSGDEESGSEDDADVQSEIDEVVLERQADLQRQREEIEDLQAAIQSQLTELNRLTNPILKNKLNAKIQSLRGDLALKQAAIGEGGDD